MQFLTIPASATAFATAAGSTHADLLQSFSNSIMRVLRERGEMGAFDVGRDRFGETIDPSISNQVSARWGNMKRPPARQGLTGEDAESTAGSTFPGVHKHAAPHTVFATVDAQSNLDFPHKKSTVKTRARSAMDRPGLEFPNVASGAPSMPALGVGNLVHAQT